MTTLKVEHLSKSHNGKQIVQDLSLSIEQGQIIGILGPNGAGKTTCFYMILGLVPADSGRIMLDSQDITKVPIHNRAKQGIGYLPQEASIFRKLSVESNINAILELRPDLDQKQREQSLEDLIAEFKLERIRKSLGISLSGGERRRVEIARCLAANPKVILLDEPFAGVDPISIQELKKLIRYLAAKNIGIVITDHNVRETLDICDKAYILSDGKIIAEGSADGILGNQEVRQVYLGEAFYI